MTYPDIVYAISDEVVLPFSVFTFSLVVTYNVIIRRWYMEGIYSRRDLSQRLFDNHVNSATLYLVDARPEQSPFCV